MAFRRQVTATVQQARQMREHLNDAKERLEKHQYGPLIYPQIWISGAVDLLQQFAPNTDMSIGKGLLVQKFQFLSGELERLRQLEASGDKEHTTRVSIFRRCVQAFERVVDCIDNAPDTLFVWDEESSDPYFCSPHQRSQPHVVSQPLKTITKKKRLCGSPITFDYTDSPLNHGWHWGERLLDEPGFVPEPDSPIGPALQITAHRTPGWQEYALDRPADQDQRSATLVEFTTVLSDGGGSRVFAGIDLQCRNRSYPRRWVRPVDGSGLAYENPNYPQTIFVPTRPQIIAPDGPAAIFRVDLCQSVCEAKGDEWTLSNLRSLRLRGSLLIARISAFSYVDWQVFISYANEDLGFVQRFTSDLERAGLGVWHYRRDSQTGSRITEEYATRILGCDFFCHPMSRSSVGSPDVSNEIGIALDHERTGRLTILPLRIESDFPIPPNLRGRKYSDFTGEYGAGLTDLLRSIEGAAQRRNAKVQ